MTRRTSRTSRTRQARGSDAPIVVQIGGAGSVPGGLSQVIEAYTRWEFEQVEVRAVATRVLGGWARTMARTARAAGTVLALRRDRQVLLAVHLSQRGSFLREGVLARLGAAIGVPYVVHLHGSDFVGFARAHPRLARFALGRARTVLVLSDESLAAVQGLVGSTTGVDRLVNAVDVPASSPKERLVVFAGAVGTRKGADLLFAAWDLLPDTDDWQLHVYGPVQMTLPTLPDSVHVEGTLDHADLLGVLGRSAVAVLPSRAEAMPLFVLEAMAAGNAVVASEVGAVGPLLEDGAGVLVAPGDAEALARALDQVMRDDRLRASLGHAARDRIRARHGTADLTRALETQWLLALT